MQILFLGSGAFGLPTLKALAEHHEVVGVVTQPDRPAGRGGKVAPTPIAEWATEHLPGVPIFKPDNVNEAGVVAQLRGLCAPDETGKDRAWVVIAFGQKLGKPLLEGAVSMNLHASLLPRWRGAAPINHAILAGDRQTGNSVITLADKMDAGLVLGQSHRTIEPGQTAGELHDLLAEDGAPLVLDVLERTRAGTLEPVEQDESKVTLAPKLSRQDATLNFAEPAEVCAKRVLGLNPWPGVTVEFQGAPLKLLRVTPLTIQGSGIPPGVVFAPEHGLVTCGPPAAGKGPAASEKNAADHTALRIDEVQPAGKRAMRWSEFVRGRTIRPGEPMIGGRGED